MSALSSNFLPLQKLDLHQNVKKSHIAFYHAPVQPNASPYTKFL